MTAPGNAIDTTCATDCLARVTHHQSYRGLTVDQNLLRDFTMYTVDLDSFGLFISDSRPAVFEMAYRVLFEVPAAAPV